MEWTHEEWIRQLREFLHDQGVDIEDLDDETIHFITNLAAQTSKGKITAQEAVRRIYEYEERRMGFARIPDAETFDMEVEYGALVDVTERVQDYLNAIEQPGLADGIIAMYAHPGLLEDERPDDILDGQALIALKSKSWFNISRCHPAEAKDIHTAVERALRAHLSAN